MAPGPEFKPPYYVAVVELEGSIIDGNGSLPGYTIAGNDTARLFDRLITDDAVVAVVLRDDVDQG